MALDISMSVFMSMMFLLGLVLIIMSFRIAESATKKDCIADSIQRSVRGLLVMSVMLLSVSLTFMICGCGMAISHNVIGMFFTVFMLIVGIVIMVLSSIIHSKCPATRKDTTVLLWLSTIATVFAGGYLGLEAYNMTAGKSIGQNKF